MLARRGMFGPIQIVQRHGVQALTLNGQTQGSSFLEPNSHIVDVTLPEGPGPISGSAYTYGWLLGGIEHPYGSALMIGLGSGAGAVQLLYNFPDMDLTIVEIDPVMAEVALRNYPLLDFYLNRGRLHIVIADATAYCSQLTETFNVGFVDAYDGTASFALLTPYLMEMRKHCRDIVLNVIDGVDGRYINRLIEQFSTDGEPLRYIMRATTPEYASYMMPKANFILTTIDISWPDVDAFEPFADRTEKSANYARQCWSLLVSNPVPVPTLEPTAAK